jgi:glucokinase
VRRSGASPASELAVGIDVGGTKCAAFRVAADGTVLDRLQEITPADDPEALLALVERLVLQMASDDVRAIGIGAAGMVDHRTGVLRYAPNLSWRELPLRGRVARATGLPVTVDNDANAAAWGEFRHGAGRDVSDMLLVTVGTGIGGGIVAGGRLYRGAHGLAAEIGHIIVEPGGPLCGCGNRGCWEQVASGRAIDRLGREAAVSHPEALFVKEAGGDPAKVTGPLVTDAAMRGDPVASSVLTEVGRRLGEGIAGLVNSLDPEKVVVGGGAAVAGEMLLEPAREAFRDAVEAPEYRPEVPIVPAELGNDAGAVGAAALALEELSS